MRIITTHIEADFDCLASMTLCRKLRPDGVLIFPGAIEEPARAFIDETGYALRARRLKGFDIEQVSAVTLVDTSFQDRIGPFRRLVEKGGIPFEIYDHHLEREPDIEAASGVRAERGATTTILIEALRERGIEIDESMATLAALGIYEDTGSLTFPTTRIEDLNAVAWLLERGARLEVVAKYINRPMSSTQIEILNRLLKDMRQATIRTLKVGLACARAPDGRIVEVASLATRALEIERLDILFVLIQFDERIQLVARALDEKARLGAIARKLGGGGHSTAASASMRQVTMPQAIDRVWRAVDEVLSDESTSIEEFIIRPALALELDKSITEAERTMTRFGIDSAPVISDQGRPIGILTRAIVEKALYHQLGGAPISEYMIRDFKSASPSSSMRRLEEIAFGARQKIIPIVDERSGKLLGIVTRGSLLNQLYARSDSATGANRALRPIRSKPVESASMARLIRARLGSEKRLAELAEAAVSVADRLGALVYIVGGSARDLIMGARNLDIDLVIEGDGIEFARALADRLKWRVRVHKKFWTATLIAPDDFKIDIATARVEFYEYPAAAPRVEPGAIRSDLYRRDFSINAMAIRLNGPRPFLLIDYFNGRADLKEKTLRVLHNLSFVEDPTRAFRAVRFAARLGFKIDSQTLALMKSAIKNRLFHRVARDRLFTEIRLILSERAALEGIEKLAELKLLPFIEPTLKLTDETLDLLRAVEESIAWSRLSFPQRRTEFWRARFFGLLDPLDNLALARMRRTDQKARQLISELERARDLFRRAVALAESSSDRIRNSAIHRLFDGSSDETLLYLISKSEARPELARAIIHFIGELRGARAALSGDDLIAAGMKPGRIFKSILRDLFHAQLDNEISSRDQAFKRARELYDELSAQAAR